MPIKIKIKIRIKIKKQKKTRKAHPDPIEGQIRFEILNGLDYSS